MNSGGKERRVGWGKKEEEGVEKEEKVVEEEKEM